MIVMVKFGIPQVIMSACMIFIVIYSIENEGESKGVYNSWITIISVIIECIILYLGGFWN